MDPDSCLRSRLVSWGFKNILVCFCFPAWTNSKIFYAMITTCCISLFKHRYKYILVTASDCLGGLVLGRFSLSDLIPEGFQLEAIRSQIQRLTRLNRTC
jgi:hypothetical protein